MFWPPISFNLGMSAAIWWNDPFVTFTDFPRELKILDRPNLVFVEFGGIKTDTLSNKEGNGGDDFYTVFSSQNTTTNGQDSLNQK